MIDHGLEILDEAKSWTLVQQGEVGRIGVTIGALPAIFPVNYRVVDGAIVFRTAAGSKLEAASRGAIVAFEVDDWDRADRSGWSVLVIGRAAVLHDLVVTRLVVDAGLEPFAPGRRTNLVRIVPEMITGRRIVHEGEEVPSPLA